MNEVFNSCPEFDPFCSQDWRLFIVKSPGFLHHVGGSLSEILRYQYQSQLESEIRLRIQYKRSQILHDGFNKKCVELFNLYKPDVNVCMRVYEPSAYYRKCHDVMVWARGLPRTPFTT